MMIYFDNAATSYPKPPCVLQEIIRATREDGGNPGRGGHRLAMRAAQTVYRTREDAAAFFGSSRPENVVFCANATAAIHTAVHALARRGNIVISDMEHNSVYRAVLGMREAGCTVTVFRTDPDPNI